MSSSTLRKNGMRVRGTVSLDIDVIRDFKTERSVIVIKYYICKGVVVHYSFIDIVLGGLMNRRRKGSFITYCRVLLV